MKVGLVAVAGRPNVGKSTLVNALTGEKIAITSTVPNTTRRRIFGVANGDGWQLVLVDLPGFQRPMDAAGGVISVVVALAAASLAGPRRERRTAPAAAPASMVER